MTTANPESILDSVKKSLGFDPDYEAFDLDITMHINAAFGSLWQLGVGGDTGFMIADNSTLWSQYISQLLYLGMAKQYIFFTVKMAFDPPATSFAIEAIQKQIQELAWRINVMAEHIDPPTDPFATVDAGPGAGSTATYFKVQVVEVPFASTVSLDAGEGNTFYLDMTGDCTINPPVNGTDGGHITLEVTSTDETVTWGAGWNFGAGGAPVLTGGGNTDIVSALYRQSDAEWHAGFSAGF